MTNNNWFEAATQAIERDPRRYPLGYFTGSSFVLSSVQVFVWFESVDALIQHISDVEPRLYHFDPGEGLEEYQERVRPILAAVKESGLTEDLRVRLDNECSSDFRIDWWGTFEDLRAGRGEFGRDILDEFLGEDRAVQAVPDDELDDFVEFLKTFRA
jgi:hypothetical protein